MNLIPIIGLEIHVQLNTKSKMFCSCANVDDGAPPNSAICPICTGQPGALPLVNNEALKKGILTGLALNCNIPDQSAFDRKNYFYPDLPKGYQISQFYYPIALDGFLDLEVPENTIKERKNIRIGITRAHLEEDAAKNFHNQTTNEKPSTLVDFNRAGTPLIEIVTEPDFRSSIEAKTFLQELRAIMRAIKVSNADMEKGQMRCDVNISMLEVDEKGFPFNSKLNPRTEIKNLNSFRAVEKAIEYEIKRQTALYKTNTPPVEATRGWDDALGKTIEQRTKENSADYRYFPEPDIPPQDLTQLKEELKNSLPELPAQTRARLTTENKLSLKDAQFFTNNREWLEFFEQISSEIPGWIPKPRDDQKIAKLLGGWLTSKLAGILTEEDKRFTDKNITAEDFAEFISILYKGEINSSNGQKLLRLMIDTGEDPSVLMEKHNLGQNMSDEELTKIVQDNIQANPEKVQEIKNGKTQLIKWFVGLVMRSSNGQANPQKAEIEITKQIKEL